MGLEVNCYHLSELYSINKTRAHAERNQKTQNPAVPNTLRNGWKFQKYRGDFQFKIY